ncbi:unnamed protein product, partial [Rotaria sordida]
MYLQLKPHSFCNKRFICDEKVLSVNNSTSPQQSNQ